MDSRVSLNVLLTRNVSELVSNRTAVFLPKPRLLYFDSYCLVLSWNWCLLLQWDTQQIMLLWWHNCTYKESIVVFISSLFSSETKKHMNLCQVEWNSSFGSCPTHSNLVSLIFTCLDLRMKHNKIKNLLKFEMVISKAIMPWVRWLVAGLFPLRLQLISKPVYVGFMVDKMAVRQFCPCVIWFFLFRIIPTMLCVRLTVPDVI